MPITEAQRELRKQYIGASDVAAILGCHPYVTARDVQLEKLGLLMPDESLDENESVDIGNDSEPYTVEWAARRLGAAHPKAALCDRTFFAANGVMAAHPDGLLEPDDGTAEPIEGKYSGLVDEFGEPGVNVVPQQFYIQLVAQMICVRSTIPVARGHIAAFLPSWRHRRRLYTFDWPGAVASTIEEMVVTWHAKHIINRDPVSVAPSREAAKRIRFQGAGSVAAVPPEHAERLLVAREVKRAAEAEYEHAQAVLLSDLAGAETGDCEGFKITTTLVPGGPVAYERKEYRRLNVARRA